MGCQFLHDEDKTPAFSRSGAANFALRYSATINTSRHRLHHSLDRRAAELIHDARAGAIKSKGSSSLPISTNNSSALVERDAARFFDVATFALLMGQIIPWTWTFDVASVGVLFPKR